MVKCQIKVWMPNKRIERNSFLTKPFKRIQASLNGILANHLNAVFKLGTKSRSASHIFTWEKITTYELNILTTEIFQKSFPVLSALSVLKTTSQWWGSNHMIRFRWGWLGSRNLLLSPVVLPAMRKKNAKRIPKI